jgi:hypothetical protein
LVPVEVVGIHRIVVLAHLLVAPVSALERVRVVGILRIVVLGVVELELGLGEVQVPVVVEVVGILRIVVLVVVELELGLEVVLVPVVVEVVGMGLEPGVVPEPGLQSGVRSGSRPGVQ